MSIKTYVDELEKLQAEIKHNNLRNKMLRQRAKELETNITTYLEEKGEHGLKYRGKAIVLENKETRAPKKKKEKESDVISFLRELGIHDAENAYTRLQDVQKGDPIEQTKLKFKRLVKE